MSEPFLGEIIMFGGNFAPRSWALCDGQLLAISQYQALFSILGTTYGGDGRNTFALPDLRGRVPLHEGGGPGADPVSLGQRGGQNTATLVANNLPPHTHPFNVVDDDANTGSPSAGMLANAPNYSTAAGNAEMPGAVGNNPTSSQSFSVMQPYLAINFIIALVGIFPSRN